MFIQPLASMVKLLPRYIYISLSSYPTIPPSIYLSIYLSFIFMFPHPLASMVICCPGIYIYPSSQLFIYQSSYLTILLCIYQQLSIYLHILHMFTQLLASMIKQLPRYIYLSIYIHIQLSNNPSSSYLSIYPSYLSFPSPYFQQ